MSVDVAIVGGCGHVGLPLGIMLARTGLQVGLVDVDEEKKELVRRGRMPFLEYGAQEQLDETIGRTLHVLDDRAHISGADYVVITVGTPVDEHLSPHFEPLFEAVSELA